jgi:hypothetical protein
MLKEWKATREKIKRREKGKRMAATKRLGQLLEKTIELFNYIIEKSNIKEARLNY